MSTILLLAQPFLTLPVFLSVLVGVPPLWLSWLIALLPWLLRLGITGRLAHRTPFDIPIFISIAGVLLGFFLSPDRQLGVTFLNSYLACVLLYYALVNNRHAGARYWVSVAAFLCLFLLFLSAWVFASGPVEEIAFNSWAYRLASLNPWEIGIRLHPNTLGCAFSLVIPALVALALFRQSAWVRLTSGVLALVFTGILVLSASGSGWVAAMAGVFVVLLYRSRRLFWGTGLAVGTAIGATWPIWHKLDWVGVVFAFKPMVFRFRLWKTLVAVLRDSPLAGLGLGGWYAYTPIGPHNAYLQLYSDTGVLGVAAFIAASVISVRLFWQVLRTPGVSADYGITVGIIAGIVAGAIYGLIDMNFSILISAEDRGIYFAIPVLWLWAAWFVICRWRLLEGPARGSELEIAGGGPG